MEITVATWVFLTAFLGITIMSILDERQKGTQIARFKRYIALQLEPQQRRRIDRTFEQRIIQPIIEKLRAILNIRISESLHQSIRMRLLNAGYPLRLTPEEFLINSVIKVGVTVVAVAGVLIFLEFDPAGIILISTVTTLLLIVFLRLGLLSRIGKRKTAIERELPELLDYCQVAVEAGLSIDSALERIVNEESGNIMAYEFKIYLHDVKMGLPRTEALHQLFLRTQVGYVKNFTDGIIQSVKTGITLGNILQIIRRDIYDDIRSRAEKRAYKAPVLMMIPMVLFIFPTVFVITLGPAILRMMSDAAKME